LLWWGGFTVISIWDETAPGFEGLQLLRNPDEGVYSKIMMKQEKLIRSQSVVARVVAGETLIVPVRAKVGDLASIYSFNGTGTLIWKLLESPHTVTTLAEAVSDAYDVDMARAEKDVTDFVNEMKVVGLVQAPAAMAMAGD
jgi:hypothetical protein